MTDYNSAFTSIVRLAPPLTTQLLSQVPPEETRPDDGEISDAFLILAPGGRIGVGVVDDDGPRVVREAITIACDEPTRAVIAELLLAAEFMAREAISEAELEPADFLPSAEVWIARDGSFVEVRRRHGEALCHWTIEVPRLC